MNDEELRQLMILIDRLKQTSMYRAYVEAHTSLIDDAMALALLDRYRKAKEDFSESVVAKHGDAQQKAVAKQMLLETKHAVDANRVLHDYFVTSRALDFFLDDLNYEINQMVGKPRKKHQRKFK